MAKPSQFRLDVAHLELLDGLAAGLRGVRTEAVRDAITYWHAAVADAGRANADELAPEDWDRLAQLNDPSTSRLMDDAPQAWDWSARLAHDLVGTWEGRAVVLPAHVAERGACRELARRIAPWGLVRGYALYLCLAYFWSHPDAGVGGGDWWDPAVWLTPTAKGDDR